MAMGMIAGGISPPSKIEWPEEVKKELSEEERPELWMPPSGPAAELETFSTQSERAKPTSLDVGKLAQAVEDVAALYPTSHFINPLDDRLYDTVVAELKTDSVSGYPYMLYSQKIEGILAHPVYAKALKVSVQARMAALMSLDPQKLRSTLCHDPAAVLKYSWADPLRVIIKKDPLPRKKIDEKRWRFILAASLADQLVERLLYSQQNKREIALWRSVPSKPGMGAEDCDAAAVRMYAEVYGLNTMSDASGWDQTVPLQMLFAEAERRILLCPEASDGWKTAVRNVMALSAYKAVMLSDGRLFTRVVPGAMASGRYCTSSSNSAMRVLCDAYARKGRVDRPISMAMGDDCVSAVSSPETYAKVFVEELHIALRDVDVFDSGQDFEFCSHLYTAAGPVHLNPAKAIARVVALGAGTEEAVLSRRVSLEHEFRHVEGADRYLRALACVNRA